MMTQTLAILLDAYRDLNARKMFWIVLVLSVIVMAAFAMVGTTDDSFTVLWWHLPPLDSQGNGDNANLIKLLYKWLFSYLVIGLYLTWIATILALISTASIFPEFMSGGAVDLYLSKPIGRLRLFLTKYITGLLFVTLQVTVFSLASFLVLGLRGHTWEPSLFMAIPIIVLFFSYLFGICVFFGVMTRSTIAALLLTILAWFFIFGIDYVDKQLTALTTMLPEMQKNAAVQVERLDRQIATLEKRHAAETQEAAANTQSANASSRPNSTDLQLDRLRLQRDRLREQAEGPTFPAWLSTVQRIVFVAKTFVPKTRETINLLDRSLLPDWQIEKAMGSPAADNGPDAAVIVKSTDPTRGRSVWWIVGSSLLFEAVVVGFAAWRFQRRDF